MAREALLKKPSVMPKSIKSTPGQPSITVSATSQTGSAIGGTLALQGTAGNKAAKAANADLAHTEGGSAAIFNKGVKGKEEPYVELLSNIGLKPDHKKLTPKPDLIAKKLHN